MIISIAVFNVPHIHCKECFLNAWKSGTGWRKLFWIVQVKVWGGKIKGEKRGGKKKEKQHDYDCRMVMENFALT